MLLFKELKVTIYEEIIIRDQCRCSEEKIKFPPKSLLGEHPFKKIGISFEFQNLSYDSEPHDIPMDYICNENGLFAC